LSNFYKTEYGNTATEVIPILNQIGNTTTTYTQGNEYRLNSNNWINTSTN